MTRFTLFKIIYGRDLLGSIHMYDQPNPNDEVGHQLIERDWLLWQLEENLEKVQVRMKTYADKNRQHEEF